MLVLRLKSSLVRLPVGLREALDETGLPWEVETGGKHHKVKLGGKLVGILPLSRLKHKSIDRRALLNTISQVRNAAREIKGKS